jgi:hypothetical protein
MVVSSYASSRCSQCRFPVCPLHGFRIVYGFPPGCPFRRANPLEALAELEARGWAALGACDYGGGGDCLDIAAVCGECVKRMLRHPHVRRLRKAVPSA